MRLRRREVRGWKDACWKHSAAFGRNQKDSPQRHKDTKKIERWGEGEREGGGEGEMGRRSDRETERGEGGVALWRHATALVVAVWMDRETFWWGWRPTDCYPWACGTLLGPFRHS